MQERAGLWAKQKEIAPYSRLYFYPPCLHYEVNVIFHLMITCLEVNLTVEKNEYFSDFERDSMVIGVR